MDTSTNKEVTSIGGYFSWEFPLKKKDIPHGDGLLLNSGHGALQQILLSLESVSKVWIPYFTCDIVVKALQDIHVPYDFYHINLQLEIEFLPKLKDNEYILYTNYFGIKDYYVNTLSDYYGSKLIIDNAQAFFADSIEQSHQIYSPRKFVGVPDGGIAVSKYLKNRCLSANKVSQVCGHLLLRTEGDVVEGYEIFKRNDDILRETSLLEMSSITRSILQSLDYELIVKKRKANFGYLHTNLADKNLFSLSLDIEKSLFKCPMVYPFFTEKENLRMSLIKNQVFVAQYWPNVLLWCKENDVEYTLCKHIIPLPIDQRYDLNEMDRILELILN